MSIYRTSQEDIAKYFNEPAMNQSSLKVILDDGIQYFIDQAAGLYQEEELMYYKEEEHFLIGKAVDCYLTEGEEVYLNRYHFSKLSKKPKDKGLSIIHRVWDIIRERYSPDTILEFSTYKEEIYKAANEHEYFMNRKKASYTEDLRLNEILKQNAEEYWKELKDAEGKIVLSDEQNKLINNIVGIITTHPHTAYLFADDAETDILYQTPLYFKWRNVLCKVLPDIIIVKHRQQEIIPLDNKTIGHYVLKFNRQMRRLRYDIQGSFYEFGISMNIDRLSEICKKNVSTYRIANFAFIVESTIRPGCPIIFPMTNGLLAQGRTGDGEKIMGWEQAIGIFNEWNKVGFSIEERLKDTHGVVFVDVDFEYTQEI